MALEFSVADASSYRMTYGQPHAVLEPVEREIEVVDAALAYLLDAGLLPATAYSDERFLAHRDAVRELFEIPWTGISPRMQRLLYAINALAQPRVMVAAGIFCGNTFISNAGAAVGPGACYCAEQLLGVEIVPEEAARAERNVRLIDASGVAQIVAADAVQVVTDADTPINLLYLDATGAGAQGKGVYLDILQAAMPRLHKGSLVLAHNSVNGDHLDAYLGYVRDAERFRQSVNVVIDTEGLEVSLV